MMKRKEGRASYLEWVRDRHEVAGFRRDQKDGWLDVGVGDIRWDGNGNRVDDIDSSDGAHESILLTERNREFDIGRSNIDGSRVDGVDMRVANGNDCGFVLLVVLLRGHCVGCDENLR